VPDLPPLPAIAVSKPLVLAVARPPGGLIMATTARGSPWHRLGKEEPDAAASRKGRGRQPLRAQRGARPDLGEEEADGTAGPGSVNGWGSAGATTAAAARRGGAVTVRRGGCSGSGEGHGRLEMAVAVAEICSS